MIDLGAIKARLDATEPLFRRPWYIRHREHDGLYMWDVMSDLGLNIAAGLYTEALANLIAHAPEDVAALVAEVERLKRERDGAAMLHECARARANRLEQEIVRLRKTLAAKQGEE